MHGKYVESRATVFKSVMSPPTLKMKGLKRSLGVKIVSSLGGGEIQFELSIM